MRQYILIFLLSIAGIVLVSCGPRRVQERVMRSTAEQLDTQVDTQLHIPDPFADLSLDDIRNNIEFFDTQVVIDDTNQEMDCPKNNRTEIRSDEQEARLIDIAIPFGARLLDENVDAKIDHTETVLEYVSTMSMPELGTFYTEQMERLGWSCVRNIRGCEQLLLFERPERFCSIVIRSFSHPHQTDCQFTKIAIFLSTSQK